MSRFGTGQALSIAPELDQGRGLTGGQAMALKKVDAAGERTRQQTALQTASMQQQGQERSLQAQMSMARQQNVLARRKMGMEDQHVKEQAADRRHQNMLLDKYRTGMMGMQKAQNEWQRKLSGQRMALEQKRFGLVEETHGFQQQQLEMAINESKIRKGTRKYQMGMAFLADMLADNRSQRTDLKTTHRSRVIDERNIHYRRLGQDLGGAKQLMERAMKRSTGEEELKPKQKLAMDDHVNKLVAKYIRSAKKFEDDPIPINLFNPATGRYEEQVFAAYDDMDQSQKDLAISRLTAAAKAEYLDKITAGSWTRSFGNERDAGATPSQAVQRAFQKAGLPSRVSTAINTALDFRTEDGQMFARAVEESNLTDKEIYMAYTALNSVQKQVSHDPAYNAILSQALGRLTSQPRLFKAIEIQQGKYAPMVVSDVNKSLEALSDQLGPMELKRVKGMLYRGIIAMELDPTKIPKDLTMARLNKLMAELDKKADIKTKAAREFQFDFNQGGVR